MIDVKNVIVPFDVKGVKTFSRKSGNTGQEIIVDSGSQYNATISAPDVEVIDLSSCSGITYFNCSVGFQSMQMVSDNDKKYYKRVVTLFIKGIADTDNVNNIEL